MLIEEVLERGKKKRKEDKRFIASAVARHFNVHKLTNGHFVAIMAALIEGEWRREPVTVALVSAEIEDPQYVDIEKDFMKSGILEHTGVHGDKSRQFSIQFMQIIGDLTNELIRTAPARMMPLTEKPAPWTGPYRDDLNLQIISHQHEHYLQHFTPENYPTPYEAINKMQDVAFRIPCYIEPFLHKQLDPVNAEINNTQKEYQEHKHFQARRRLYNKLRGLYQKRVQIQAQIALIKEYIKYDKLYFVVTFDYRGRMYYRGGICTPQGNDFCKAVFQLAR